MLWRRKRSDTDFREEIQAHIVLEAERLREQGSEPKTSESRTKGIW
jgi:hypothetical protein